MKFLNYISILLAILIISCNSENDELQEAKLAHNEAMAIFSDTRPLLKELNEARRELIRRTGISTADSAMAFETDVLDTVLYNDTTGQIEDMTELNQKGDTTLQPDDTTQGIMENIPEFSDTTAAQEVVQALRDLNEAQNDLLLWMRNIYQIPGYEAIYEDEKAPADPAIGKDYDSRMLLTDMQFIQMPDDATNEEILQVQKEMKEEILKINVEIKRAIENARSAYLKYN